MFPSLSTIDGHPEERHAVAYEPPSQCLKTQATMTSTVVTVPEGEDYPTKRPGCPRSKRRWRLRLAMFPLLVSMEPEMIPCSGMNSHLAFLNRERHCKRHEPGVAGWEAFDRRPRMPSGNRSIIRSGHFLPLHLS